MTDFGHEWSQGDGVFLDAWGAGPYVLTASGKRWVFEDSEQFGPAELDPKTGDPTNVMIPEGSAFWRHWERWVAEGRKTREGKPIGRGRWNQLKVLYCVYSPFPRGRYVE